jgi:ParB-like chromosome segregation protein Spo0J
VQEARVAALVGNVQRVDLSSYEVARSMAELRSDGMQQKEIAGKIKKSKSWVSRKLAAWDNASPTVKGAWKAGWLPDEDVEALASIRSIDQKTGKDLKEPDHKEQDKRLEKLLAHRAVAAEGGKDSRKAAGKARKIAKGGEPRGEKPSGDKVRRYAVAAAESKNPYVRGLRDMALYVLGEMPVGKFDKAWLQHASSRGFYKSDAPAKTKALAKRKAPPKKKGAPKRAK